MNSFCSALACCGLGLSLNTPISVAAEWEPVNNESESKSTTINQVDRSRSTHWSTIQTNSAKSTNIKRQVVWKPVEPSTEVNPSQPSWTTVNTETIVKEPIRWKPVEPAIAQDIEDDIDNEQPIKDASVKNVAIKLPVMPSGATFANDKAIWRDDNWHPQISSLVPVGFGPQGTMISLGLYGWDCIPVEQGPCKYPENWEEYREEIELRGEAEWEGSIGLGDASRLAGLTITGMFEETSIPIGERNNELDNSRDLFSNYYIGMHLSRNLGDDTAVRVGIKNWIDVREDYNSGMRGKSAYGVISQRIRLNENQESWLPNLYITAGLGNGEFRGVDQKFKASVSAQRKAGCLTYGVTGSEDCSSNTRNRAGGRAASYGEIEPIGAIALEAYPGFNLIGEWNEGNLKAGFSVKPFKDAGLTFTSMWGSLLRNCDWGCKVSMPGVPGGVDIPGPLTTERIRWSFKVDYNIKF